MVMYFFRGYQGLEISFSEVLERRGKKQLRIYATYTDPGNSGKAAELEMWLPDCEITLNKGFPPEKIADVKRYVKNGSDDLWDIAEHGDADLYS